MKVVPVSRPCGTGVVSFGRQMFGLRICARRTSIKWQVSKYQEGHPWHLLPVPSYLRAPRVLAPAFASGMPETGSAPALKAEWGSVMRYRSATVAGFHGLPCDC